MKKRSIIEVISAILIIPLLYTSISKFANADVFNFQLSLSPNINAYAGLLTWIVPLVELLLALLLLISRTRTLGFYFTTLLFAGYIYAMFNFVFYIPCSCGGILDRMSFSQHLTFNIVMLILSVAGILVSLFPKKQAKEKLPETVFT